MGQSFAAAVSGSGAVRKRLTVVADNALIVEAIQSGLRGNTTFEFLGYVDPRRTSLQTIIDATPDVVLVDDMDQADDAIRLTRDLHGCDERITILVLAIRMDPAWLARAFQAGASGAISKAVHPMALGTLVRETLNGNLVHAPKSGFIDSDARRGAVKEHGSLTQREFEILRLVASGVTNDEIAQRLWVTRQTVKFHLSNIYRKLDVANRTEACHYAHVNGLVTHEPLSIAS